jgi:hypothetical protein
VPELAAPHVRREGLDDNLVWPVVHIDPVWWPQHTSSARGPRLRMLPSDIGFASSRVFADGSRAFSRGVLSGRLPEQYGLRAGCSAGRLRRPPIVSLGSRP